MNKHPQQMFDMNCKQYTVDSFRTSEYEWRSYLLVFDRSDNYKRLTIYENKRFMRNGIMLYC